MEPARGPYRSGRKCYVDGCLSGLWFCWSRAQKCFNRHTPLRYPDPRPEIRGQATSTAGHQTRDKPGSRRGMLRETGHWLTHQVQPGVGDDNHSSEEDFNLIQAYLSSEHLQRRWQKVSIPLDELYQNALATNSDSTKLFLKFMLDHSYATGGIGVVE